MSLLESTSDMISAAVSRVEDGHDDGIALYAQLRELSDVIAQAQEQISPHVMDALRQYGKDGFVVGDKRFEVRYGPGRWSYPNTQEYQRIEAEKKGVEAELKRIAQMAQTAQKMGANVTTEDGVIIEPGVYVSGKETIYATKA